MKNQAGSLDRPAATISIDELPVVAHSRAGLRAVRGIEVPRLVVAFAMGIAAIAAVALLAFVLDREWPLFKLGEENNIPTWFSSMQLFAVAVVLTPLALRDVDRTVRSTWMLWLAPGLFAFLSLDEVAMTHERLGDWLQGAGVGEGLRTGPWMFVFLPLVGLIGLAAARSMWPYLRNRLEAKRLAISGALFFVVAAVGLESMANFVTAGSLMHKFLGFAEEIGEMVAVALLLWSALSVVSHEGFRLQSDLDRTSA